MRTGWFLGTMLGSAAAFALAIALAPAEGASGGIVLSGLLFFGSSAHVASTAWFATQADVRAEARRRSARYVVAPVALVSGAIVAAVVLDPSQLAWPLLAFFGWQFFHFQKQNLGLTALALVAHGAPSLNRYERSVIVAAGVTGTVGLVARPELLLLDLESPLRALFLPAAVATGIVAALGIALLVRRSAKERPAPAVALFLMSLVFFAPVFLFSSPFAAVSGIVIAHGLQYLLLVGLVAAGTPNRHERIVALAVLVNVALVGGMLLNVASRQLHDGAGTRAFYARSWA